MLRFRTLRIHHAGASPRRHRGSRSRLLGGGLLALALLLGAQGAQAKRASAPSTGLRDITFGKRTPDFSYDLGSGPQRLSDLYGKPVVLNFWATWCHPCTEELGVFAHLQKEYGARVALLTISAEPAGIARTYVNDKGYGNVPIVEDPQSVVFGKYAITPLPVTLVLAPNGALMHVSIGELDWPELQGAVDRALSAPSS